MIYEDALSALRRHVAAAFKAGTSTFPHYTLHGEEHLQELDRLALLVGGSIPKLSKERLNLLRLAIILHDFAMVDVPDPAREKELRRQMTPGLPFADIVRMTHQDEIDRSFTKPERIALLHGLLPTAGAQILEDASTIARHHRLHPLAQAPEHVQDLCALMRILDELDIGPNRAPLPAYDALRPKMEDVASRFHWLKHLCTRPVAAYGTFSVEERNHRRILKVLVAVKATENTWRAIQEVIISKLKKCADQEGVNEVLQATLGVQFELEPAPEPTLSGIQLYLATTVRQDLESLPSSFFEISHDSQQPPPNPAQPSSETRLAVQVEAFQERSAREFKIVALPPETLAEALCLSGRLTMIGNRYVKPVEETVGGLAGAPNRIYVGPADCGKTRAALEWIVELTDSSANQWVVLRTGMGTLPETMESIILDTSHYEENRYLLPQKAILFLDDLPTNLPPPSATFTANDAVQVLFRWFQELPYFRDRHLVGTLRLEDTHARPEWPEVLSSLGQPLELVRLLPLEGTSYRELWEGMTTGAISRSLTEGVSSFSMDLAEGFLQSVAKQPADPEAVAVFIQQNALKTRTVLESVDAERFSASAVETWFRETWPALLGAYGLAVKVFFTLARFFEASLRPASGFPGSIGPAWQPHEAFGPELCVLAGSTAESYVPCLRRLIDDGHATGKVNEWIRPRADFLLQADNGSGLEFTLPSLGWFAERCERLGKILRRSLAFQFGLSNGDLTGYLTEDAHWLAGLGGGLGRLADLAPDQDEKARLLTRALELLRIAAKKEPNATLVLTDLAATLGRQAQLFDADREEKFALEEEEIDLYRRAIEADPQNSYAWGHLGDSLSRKAARQESPLSQNALREEVITAYRRAADAYPQYAYAWHKLGAQLARKAERAEDPESQEALREEAIAACRRATDAAPQYADAWHSLGAQLAQKAERVEDPESQKALHEEAIAACRRATDAAPQYAYAWHSLGACLAQKAERTEDPESQRTIHEEAIAAYRRATDAVPQFSLAWSSLGYCLNEKANREENLQSRKALREEALVAYRCAIDADPNNSQAWLNLGIDLSERTKREERFETQNALREEAIGAYERVIDVDPKNFIAWHNLGVSLGQKADREKDPQKQEALREEEIAAYRSATTAYPQHSQTWLYLGASLGQKADREEDLQRQNSLREEEIDAYRRATDTDSQNASARLYLGASLGQKADREEDPQKQEALREEEIAAYRRAIEVDPQMSEAWDLLSAALVTQGRESQDVQLFQEAIEAAARAVSLGAERYNFACALAIAGDPTKALLELKTCLKREEISRENVLTDPNWAAFQQDPQFLDLLAAGA